jgi:predicted site-specific integrase-resolvase
MENQYLNTRDAKKILNITTKTLQNYDREGKIEVIRTATNRRMYNVNKYLEDNNLTRLIKETKKNIIYCRVSSYDRKEDLERQVNFLSNLYKDYEIVKDIGSGINFKRKGLIYIIDLAINNKLNEVVITYKDRLCRIGYEMIEFILTKYSNANINIINKVINDKNEEITKDLIEIITVYSSKLHGTRSNI